MRVRTSPCYLSARCSPLRLASWGSLSNCLSCGFTGGGRGTNRSQSARLGGLEFLARFLFHNSKRNGTVRSRAPNWPAIFPQIRRISGPKPRLAASPRAYTECPSTTVRNNALARDLAFKNLNYNGFPRPSVRLSNYSNNCDQCCGADDFRGVVEKIFSVGGYAGAPRMKYNTISTSSVQSEKKSTLRIYTDPGFTKEKVIARNTRGECT